MFHTSISIFALKHQPPLLKFFFSFVCEPNLPPPLFFLSFIKSAHHNIQLTFLYFISLTHFSITPLPPFKKMKSDFPLFPRLSCREALLVFCSSTHSCGLLLLPRQPGVHILLFLERNQDLEKKKKMNGNLEKKVRRGYKLKWSQGRPKDMTEHLKLKYHEDGEMEGRAFIFLLLHKYSLNIYYLSKCLQSERWVQKLLLNHSSSSCSDVNNFSKR